MNGTTYEGVSHFEYALVKDLNTLHSHGLEITEILL